MSTKDVTIKTIKDMATLLTERNEILKGLTEIQATNYALAEEYIVKQQLTYELLIRALTK